MIADDHMLFAEAVQAAIQGLGMSVTHIVTTGEGAITEVDRAVPDVIFMDIGLPDQSGLMAGRIILERHPEARIIALTALSDRSAVEEALRIGFVGYLTKDTPVARFVNAIRSAVDGHLVLPQRLSPVRRQTQVEKDVALMASQLTPREREVLTLLVRGADGRRAAATLGISLNTVRTHVQSILTKLQVHSRLEAATFAVRHGIVSISGPDEGREAI
ncbi:MAG TPA: response regulator transcription factor [Actinomycetota bacterium]|nr:response regulator transcription factor [Actinomycetota bacterium]